MATGTDFALGPATVVVLSAFQNQFGGVFPMLVGGEWLFGKLARFRPVMGMTLFIGHVVPNTISALAVFFNATDGVSFAADADGTKFTLRIAEGDEVFTVRIVARSRIHPNLHTTMEGLFATLYSVLEWNTAAGMRPHVPVTAANLSRTSLRDRAVYSNIDSDTLIMTELRTMCAEAGFAYVERKFNVAPLDVHEFYQTNFAHRDRPADPSSGAARAAATAICGYHEMVRTRGDSPRTPAYDIMHYMSPADRIFMRNLANTFTEQIKPRRVKRVRVDS